MLCLLTPQDLRSKFAAAGSTATAFAVHPGIQKYKHVYTYIYRHMFVYIYACTAAALKTQFLYYYMIICIYICAYNDTC